MFNIESLINGTWVVISVRAYRTSAFANRGVAELVEDELGEDATAAEYAVAYDAYRVVPA